MPPGLGISFVITGGLDAAALTGLAAPLVVRALEPRGSVRTEPDHVYLVPPGARLRLRESALTTQRDAKVRLPGAQVDELFTQLVRVFRGRAIGIVLAVPELQPWLGAEAITRAGGLVMGLARGTQDASPPVTFDFYLPSDRLADELVARVAHDRDRDSVSATVKLAEEVGANLSQLCEALLDVTGHDFRHYKHSTLVRRTLRRIQILRLPSATAYIARLHEEPAECERLFKDLLINVTAFFRDPEAFASLSRTAIERVLQDREPGAPLRIWVPGCATGEEAYSIAMLVLEAASPESVRPQDLQIFATDLDEGALAIARQGSYPPDIVDEVSPARLERFFTQKGPRYHVNPELRECVLFSLHNLINDPPFSKVDLISCRNLLIYLGSHLQEKLIPLFHYALRPGGYLFLGPSEGLEAHRELFRAVDAKHRISQRLPTAIRSSPGLTGRYGPFTQARLTPMTSSPETDIYLVMQRIVLDEFAPKAVVVDEGGSVVSASGNLEKYLTVDAGPFQNNITRLVRGDLRVPLRAALREAAEIKRKIVSEEVSLVTEAGVQRVILTVQPMPQLGDGQALFLVVFSDVGRLVEEAPRRDMPGDTSASALIERLERDLTATRRDMEALVQELEAANEELKSSNEELLSMNEELQSGNEELETSKEDLQVANVALATANDDLENLLTSTQIATIFLDREGLLRRFTPDATSIYNIRPSDIGRPLAHYTHAARHMPALPPLDEVRRAPSAIEHELELVDGRHYLRRVSAYRASDGDPQGVVVTFLDISHRKLAARNLEESELRLRGIIDSMFAFVGLLDLDGTLRETNRAPLEAANLGRAEVIGRKYWECAWWTHDPAVQDRLRAAFARAVAGEVVRYDETIRVRGDERIVIDLMLQPVTVDGEVRFVIPSGVDVTARVAAETETQRLARDLGRRVEETETLLRVMPVGIGIAHDTACRRITVNPAFASLLAIDQDVNASLTAPAAERPKNFRVFAGGREVASDMLPLQVAAREGLTVTAVEVDVVHDDGRVLHLLEYAAPLFAEDGRPRGSVGAFVDISEQRAITSALERRERELRSLADNSPDILTRFDRAHRHLFVNLAVERATGRRRDEFLGKSNRELGMPPELCDLWDAALGRVFEAGVPETLEFSYATSTGVRHYVARLVPEADASGKVETVLSVAHDQTDVKLANEALRDADHHKDEFLAMLAHELRNPLAPLRSGIELLRQGTGGDAERIHAMMSRQFSHMVRLVDDLLDVSRISRGKLELHLERIDIRAAVEAAIETAKPAIDANRHALGVHLPSEAIYVEADATRLAQMVSNLLNNAAKYTPSGGEIELTVGCDGGRAFVRVTDNGFGLPPEQLPHIFSMFTQIARTKDHAQGGLGIGLALVHRLAELHGGTITAASAGSDQGSTFTLELPVSVSDGPTLSPRTSPRTGQAEPKVDAARRVLIIDDNHDAAEMLAVLLEQRGFTVQFVTTGEAGLDVVPLFRPHVVLLDIGLPDMSGYDVARKLRESFSSSELRIVALSGWGTEQDKERSHAAGCDDHFVKPVSVQALFSAIA